MALKLFRINYPEQTEVAAKINKNGKEETVA